MPDLIIGVGDPKRPYKPVSETIRLFHMSQAKTRLLVGPFGSGKSVAAIFEILMNSALSHNTRYVFVRDTYRNLQDTVIKTFFECVPEAAGVWQKSELIFTMPSSSGGSIEILFRSAETPEDVKKFRGLEITGFWLDESQDLSPDVKMILGGRLRFPATHPHYIGILTTNPCDTEHWIYSQFVANPLEDHAFWRQPSRDNPHLPPGYYERMEAEFRDRPEMLRRYVHGEWGAVFDGKPVYGNEFNFDMHVGKGPLKPVDGTLIVRGWDFGLSPACVWAQVDYTGQLKVFKELCGDDVGIDEFSDAVLEISAQRFPGFTFEDVGDPAGKARSATDERSCYDILATKGIHCVEAETNALIPRLEAVKKRLTRAYKGKPRIIIDPNCKRLIDGFSGGYKYRERGLSGGGQLYSETPEKNKYSHIHDAIQYLCLYLFGYMDPVNSRLFTEPLKVEGITCA